MHRRPKNAVSATSPPARFSLRGALLAALVALFAARPLLPSEGSVTADGEGLPFVLLTLILANVWLLAGFYRGELRVRLSWADAGWIALLGFQAASTWRASQAGAARPAINLFWEWVALGVGFFLARQLITSAREARAVTAVMLALCVALSAYGLHQYFVTTPETRAEYHKNPEKLLRELKLSAEPGSTERVRFEKRLESSEPTATFALANSLAGVLAPWLIVAAGLALSNRRLKPASPEHHGDALRTLAGLSLTICAMLACLLLTKSRSAWLASATGFAGLGVTALRRGGLIHRRMVFAGGALLIALVVAAIGAGSLDREVLTEASKSLGYRWQYWQASLAMIKDQPWLGCGLGNFQDEYTRYKLPEASEVVADPHNFLFEVWATSGTPALAAFLAIFVGACWDLLRPSRRSAIAAKPTRDDAAADWLLVLAGGVLGGFSLAFFIGLASTVVLSSDAVLGGVAVSAAVLWLLAPWIRQGSLPIGLPLLAAAVLAINLLAAGGIGFPGVAGSLWLLLAIGLSLSAIDEGAIDAPRAALRGPPALLATCLAAGALACFVWSDYLPVMQCRLLLLQAESTVGAPRDELLKSAAEADPKFSQPWELLAANELSRWRSRRDRAALERWEADAQQVIERRPHWAAARVQAGNTHLEAYQVSHRDADVQKAVAAYAQAVELYPNHAENHARLAVALAAAGQRSAARQAAAKALRLDELTPHDDQKLTADLRQAVERLR